jgi:hypothetical protein
MRLSRQKKKNILTLVLSEKKFLNETKTITPPLQVKWSVPNCLAHMTADNNIVRSICYSYLLQ